MPDHGRELFEHILQREGTELTSDQHAAAEVFLDFYNRNEPFSVFILRGAAGTGKTFMIRLLQKYMTETGRQAALLAPTGRAAKVITRRTRKYASTIHRYIYTPAESAGGGVFFTLKENNDSEKVCYIADEASMIGDGSDEAGTAGGSGDGLLADLLRFVYTDSSYRKLILVGDSAQLPPVGSSLSPALDPDYLKKQYHLKIYEAALDEVMRQDEASPIVTLANLIRRNMEEGSIPVTQLRFGREVQQFDQPWEMLETYSGLFETDNTDKAVILTYSNRMATEINKSVRKLMFEAENTLIRDEVVMVVRNNYAWGHKAFPFIANGESGIVREVFYSTFEERYGLKFMDAEIEFTDLGEKPVLVRCKVLLDLLDSARPQLEYAEMQRLIQLRRQDMEQGSKSMMAELTRKDPYIHALQIKYGYAVTGHKSQGGQWQHVLVAFEPLYKNMNMRDYLRWTYTCFTRAEERLYVLGFPFLPKEF